MEGSEPDLLTSPIERTALNRLFVIGGPIALAIGIVLSLWVHQQRITHGLVVQAERSWIAEAPLAIRVQVVTGSGATATRLRMSATLEHDGGAIDLLSTEGPDGLAQGRFVVPSVPVGSARLRVRTEAIDTPAFDETFDVAIVAQRDPVRGEAIVSSSMSQYADDSDPQPASHRIVVRPDGRLLSSFDNELYIRVTDDKGAPWRGTVEVLLADGEFMEMVGKPDAPVSLAIGPTDPLGLFAIAGPLASEVLRLEVRALGSDDPASVLAKRRVRLVSFAGAVTAAVEPRVVAPGQAIDVLAFGLSAKRPVFVDLHAPDGAWIDTLQPPILGREPPRTLMLPQGTTGLYQIEAYHFTNEPGESTALGRVLLADDTTALASLVARQRDDLEVARRELGFDVALEKAWLDHVAAADLDPQARALAQRFLVGTLPPRVFGPPLLGTTHERDRQALATWKRNWTIGLRIYMLGGGALFLLAMTLLMIRSHARGATATLQELADQGDAIDRAAMADQVARARRDAFLRGLAVVAVMAGAIVMTVLLLENLLWET